MDSRTAAHVLSQIAAHLELNGENAFKHRAYEMRIPSPGSIIWRSASALPAKAGSRPPTC